MQQEQKVILTGKKLSSVDIKNPQIDLSDNSRTILEKRYLRKNADGSNTETIEEMFERIATAVAKPDEGYRNVEETSLDFYNMLTTKRFFPNSPTFTGAGTPLGQLAACFVLPVEDDMGRGENGIFSTLRNAALIQQTGGGNGFSFSDLRPSGSFVKTSGGKATGPVGFMSVYDKAFEVVAQGGVRRGANMGVLRVDHPNVREFIKCKSAEGSIANFNISVAITDKFMKAVKDDTTYDLIAPHTGNIVESPKAREIFDMIVEYAHKNGEPGVLFIDAANRTNPVPHLYELKTTNPCGEQWLGPYENCCLGSINLLEHVVEGVLDWGLLEETIVMSTRFLDNVVSANTYVPEIPQLKTAAENARRIGLGLMGLADVMYLQGIRYGSEEGQEFAAQIMEFIRYHSMRTSILLAEERGAFLKIKGSIYDPEDLKWRPPLPLVPFTRNFDRPQINWQEVVDGIKEYGIRNAAQTTVAPTGTISTVAGVEGYGCEPVFALAYYRNVYQASGGDNKITLTYSSPAFVDALDKAGVVGEAKKKIIDKVITKGTCQHIIDIPDSIRSVFVVSADITPDEHIRMQAAIQAFVDNSISKTCNFPVGASTEDVAKAYLMGWELGCKGLTVYVTGSRQEVVLETKEVKLAKSGSGVEINVEDVSIFDRGQALSGSTHRVHTPQGKAFVTINKTEHGDPVEVFINVGKAGTDVAALSEALGRLLSGWLRASKDRTQTVKEIVVQLIGIGGANSVGFGKNRVGSIPDAVAQTLAEEFNISVRTNGDEVAEKPDKDMNAFAYADMCPECGNSSLVLQEGCSKCYTCGYSKC